MLFSLPAKSIKVPKDYKMKFGSYRLEIKRTDLKFKIPDF